MVRIAGEGGVDNDPLPVAHHQEGRVFQTQGIVGQLLEGGVQVTARFFVLPAETAALPDIGPAVTAASLFRPSFKTVAFRVTGLVNSQQVAEVVKMGLGSAAFAEGVVSPEGDELFRSHVAMLFCIRRVNNIFTFFIYE